MKIRNDDAYINVDQKHLKQGFQGENNPYPEDEAANALKDPMGILNVKHWTFSGFIEAILLLSTILAGSLYIMSQLQPNIWSNMSKEWNNFLSGMLTFVLEIGPNIQNLVIGILEFPMEIVNLIQGHAHNAA